MLSVIIGVLQKIGLAVLGQFFVSAATEAHDKGVDSRILDYLYQLVRSAEANPLLSTGNQKYEWVWREAITFLHANSLNLTVTLVQSLIALAVHYHHLDNGILGQTVSFVAAQLEAPAPASSPAKD